MTKPIHVRFWGTRGSTPASISAGAIREKIVRAIGQARDRGLKTDEEIARFVEGLPMSVGGCYGGNTPCVEIEGGEEYIICDAGTGIKDLGYSLAPGTNGSTFRIFMSHFHWGHIQGFPFFAPAYVPGNLIRIYGFHGVMERAFEHQQTGAHFPVPLQSMGADIQFVRLKPGRDYHIGGFTVRGIEQCHPGVSYGYRFQRDGKAIVYSTDAEHKTSYDSAAREETYPFIDFFRDADLLIFDAPYDWNEAVLTKDGHGHSDYTAAVELSVRANVKHLCMFHSEPTHTDERLEMLLDDARSYLKIHTNHTDHPLKIDLAYDGLGVEI